MTTLIVLRGRLLYRLGRLDEHWYWFYQSALCWLDADPAAADAMYRDDTDRHLATCRTAASPRAPRGTK
ncbi:hypothetical protein ACIQNI_08715 [Streptomyces sp. NPDC091266]|uniref:hypothetical protein n=1 Tax=Streptomyces sp. NPDC091266 TaxID=3365978 RepID=UPI003805C951